MRFVKDKNGRFLSADVSCDKVEFCDEYGAGSVFAKATPGQGVRPYSTAPAQKQGEEIVHEASPQFRFFTKNRDNSK